MAELESDSSVFRLETESEMRIVVPEQESNVTLELLTGLAEVFGTEMIVNKIYNLSPSSSIAVFTWHGCTLKLLGNVEKYNIEKDTFMIIPVSLHACLEEMRIAAETNDSKGPVSMIVGPSDVGKSTLGRILLNYAARLGRRPLFIDLDVGQNSISIPGSIGILPIEKPADIVQGFGQQALSVYHFGYKSPGHNILLYFLLIKKLGQTISSRMRDANKNMRTSGVVIDTCGWVRGHGYHSLTLAALAFEIDVLFVLEEERLFTQLKRDMPSCVQVVYVPKLSGVNERSRPLRIKVRDARVQEYFYGSQTVLVPHSFQVKFSDIQIFQLLAPPIDESIPITDVNREDITITPVTFGPHLVNQILGISFADSTEEDIMFTNIIGYICITHVDMNEEAVTVLSPQPAPLPKRILLMGDIRLILR